MLNDSRAIASSARTRTSPCAVHGERYHVRGIGRNEAAERFADMFAAEFLVPTHAASDCGRSDWAFQGSLIQSGGHLQRYSVCPYAMLLLPPPVPQRLADQQDVDRMREVHPVTSRNDGNRIAPDDGLRSRIRGASPAPTAFLRPLRRAYFEQRLTLAAPLQ